MSVLKKIGIVIFTGIVALGGFHFGERFSISGEIGRAHV
jgi:hypothetical protein